MSGLSFSCLGPLCFLDLVDCFLSEGGGAVQKAPCSARKPVQLGGVLGARGGALWRLVWMVEGLVKQGAGGGQLIRI